MKKEMTRFIAGALAILLAAGHTSDYAYAAEMQENDIIDVPKESQENADTTEKIQTDETDSTAKEEGGELGHEENKEGQDHEKNQEVTNDKENPEKTEDQDEIPENEKVSVKGKLEIVLTAGLEIEGTQKFQIELTGKDTQKKEMELLYNEENLASVQKSVEFSNLEHGSYQLHITGDGYGTYSQNFDIEGMNYKVQVYAGMSAGFEEGQPQPGVLPYGDVTGDHILDQEDARKLVDAIDQGLMDSEYDLNKDKNINLLDLQYFSQGYEVIQAKESAVEKSIPKEAAVIEVGDNAIFPENMEAVWTGEETVTIGNKNGSITDENPLEISFNFGKSQEPVVIGGFTIEAPQNENQIESGEIVIEFADGSSAVYTIPSAKSRQAGERSWKSGPSVTRDEAGNLVVNLAGQIAVKKVTLKVTSTVGGGSLVDISKVEFVNDMESKIPAPEMNIPQGLTAAAGNKEFTASWQPERNVTGYELEISDGNKKEYRKTSSTSIKVTQFQNEKLKNKKEYTLRVQSVNGTWKSGFSDAITVIPKTDKKPDAPDGLTVTGKYRAAEVRWKALEDADTYNLFYKDKNAEKYEKIEGITGTYYLLNDLADNTTYEVYLTAVNDLGEGPKSLSASAATINLKPAVLPAYKLINTSTGEGSLSTHIKDAQMGVSAYTSGRMVDSPLDSGKSALGLFDNSYASYFQIDDWDFGASYQIGSAGISAELDAVYEIGMITWAEPQDIGSYKTVVRYVDENGNWREAEGTKILQKTDKNGRNYYLVKFNGSIKTSKLMIGIGRNYSGLRKLTISEMRFYEYDSIEQDILNLYDDELHLSLRSDVSEDEINKLQERLDTPDEVSKELHPEKESLQKELDAARKLLHTQGLNDSVMIHTDISTRKDGNLGITGLNAWQPLGVTAAAGEEIIVYVGKENAKDGENTPLQLIMTQQHAESTNLTYKNAITLKTGRNEITIPKWISTDVEKGGALYVQYTGSSASDKYAVRVSGGQKYPVLDLYKTESTAEKSEKISSYVKELTEYTAGLDKMHEEKHNSGENENLHYEYDPKTCILNMTDIMLDQMMLSIPASQVIKGLGEEAKRADTLTDSIDAVNQMMTLFYQHKGLTDSFAEGTPKDIIEKNSLPSKHLNIRYMKMFSGAFMYAAGDHIGIEWNETLGMVQGKVPETTEEGKLISGQYFGWGIAHEIGHQINQSAYAVAEITNNYFALLAQANEKNDGVRFSYKDVYEKVTSGTAGRDANVFTQLAMYWQLHLAYDRGYNFKMYDTYQEMSDNLFFARVDSYARNPESAPKPQGEALTLTGDTDQKFMRLACAAAQKNLLGFFERWGMTPDLATKRYAEQFEEEERAIYYVNDEARAYEIENPGQEGIAGQNVVSTDIKAQDSKVTLDITNTVSDPELILGYEITRIYTEQGKEQREVIGFTESQSFTDQAASLANKVVSYEVTAIDQFTNRSQAFRTEEVKLYGDGIQDKSFWTIRTNMVSAQDEKEDATQQDPCAPVIKKASAKMIDGKTDTTYIGKAVTEDPYILLEMNQSVEASALRYTFTGEGHPISEYKIEISSDGVSYRTVKTGKFSSQNNGSSETVYFENQEDLWVATYDVSYVKITAIGAKNKEISISELDIFGPSGDNMEFQNADGKPVIGILKKDYEYADNESIPAGSMIFIGTYKGNPAYNVMMLYDEEGKIVGGVDEDDSLRAEQLIFAPDPGEALLGEVSEGIWIYWIEPLEDGSLPDYAGKKVRGELYRVDHALTNEGQRFVSDTLWAEVPEHLEEITIPDQK